MLIRMLLAPVLLTCGLGVLWAQQNNNASQAPADNTKVNQRDRNPSEPTADQQKRRLDGPSAQPASTPRHRER
jgi:hypothetical protein